MSHQPAYRIGAPMGWVRPLPAQDDVQRLMYGIAEPRLTDGGIPTFFPEGNRSSVSNHEPSGKPVGLQLLAVSPMRFNETFRNELARREVSRKSMTQTALTRARAKATPVGR